MGQRHQIYIIEKKKNKYTCIGAFHHQWTFGFKAANDLIRLASAVETAKSASLGKWSEYTFSDNRECHTLVSAIYGLDPFSGYVSMVHNESDTSLIDDDQNARPEFGDNNDGASLVVIDNDTQEVRACLFTPGHLEGEFASKVKPWVSYTPQEYLDFYYKKNAERNKNPRNELIEKTKIKHVDQKEFSAILKTSMKNKKDN